MNRPNFSDLTAAEQAQFGNGVGPSWFPKWARRLITKSASWFFEDASWRHHDFGYVVGGDRWDRARCDYKFLAAMLKDAVSQPWYVFPVAAPLAILISLFFYVMVRILGQFGSFEYRDRYRTLAEVRNCIRKVGNGTMD